MADQGTDLSTTADVPELDCIAAICYVLAIETNSGDRLHNGVKKNAVKECGLARVAEPKEKTVVRGVGVETTEESGEFEHCYD